MYIFKDPKVWDLEGSLHSTEGIIVELTKQLMEEINCYFPLFLETKVKLLTDTTYDALCLEIIISFETYRLNHHNYHQFLSMALYLFSEKKNWEVTEKFITQHKNIKIIFTKVFPSFFWTHCTTMSQYWLHLNSINCVQLFISNNVQGRIQDFPQGRQP